MREKSLGTRSDMGPSFILGFYIVVVFFALSSQKSEAPDTV
jgi:hypothetical protein